MKFPVWHVHMLYRAFFVMMISVNKLVWNNEKFVCKVCGM